MTYPDNHDIQNIKVDFKEVHGGWMEFSVSAGDQRYDTWFSCVYDPIASLRKWLEALTTGVYQCGFCYDIEGQEIIWSFTQTHWNKGIFHVMANYLDDESPAYVASYADRKQIVNSLYLGFLHFFGSDKYKPAEWEVEYMWERITKATNTTYDQTVETLLELDRKDLKTLLFNANPTYLISYPQASDKNEEWNLFLQDTIDKENNNTNQFERVETPMEWNIPEDYDYWTREKKVELVEQCLAERVSTFEAEKPEVFRSKLIEKYLTDE